MKGVRLVFPPLVKVKVEQLVRGRMMFTDLTNLEEHRITENPSSLSSRF